MRSILFVVAAALAFPPVAFGVIVPGSKDLGNIWFIGDSITQSNSDGDPDSSPRSALYDLLTAADYSFTFTGHATTNGGGLPVTGSTPSTNLYIYHSGVAGSVIGATQPDGRVGITQSIPTWWNQGRLAVAKPDVILIMIGTNNIYKSIEPDKGPELLTTLIDTIYAQPGIGSPTIFLASIPPDRSTQNSASLTATFNAGVPGVVDHFRDLGKDVYFVDQFTDLEANYASLMNSDNLHPNGAGNQVIGQNWFDAIQAVAVPEPSVAILLGLGAGIMGGARLRRA